MARLPRASVLLRLMLTQPDELAATLPDSYMLLLRATYAYSEIMGAVLCHSSALMFPVANQEGDDG